MTAKVPSLGPTATRPMYRSQARRTTGKAAVTVLKVLAVSIMAVATLGHVNPGLVPPLQKALGAVLIIGMLHLQARRLVMPTEVQLYFAFLAWALVTAFLVAEAPDRSFRHGWTVFQMGLFLWAVTVAHIWRPDLRIVMVGLWILGVAFVFLVMFSPDLMYIVEEGHQRLSVFEVNPNGVAENWVFAILAALYLGKRLNSLLLRIVALGSIIPFSLLILFTGSRKMLLAEVLVFSVWFFMFRSARKGPLRTRSSRLLIVLVMVAVAYVTASLWERSAMSKRWEKFRDPRSGEVDFGRRDDLYVEGLRVFLQAPVTGVGLANQEQEQHIGSMAHSEYVDVLASTGLVGAVLYFSIYLRLVRRGRRRFRSRGGLSESDWCAFRTYMVLLLWLMAGFLRYTNFPNLLLLGAFAGHFVSLERWTTLRLAGPPFRNSTCAEYLTQKPSVYSRERYAERATVHARPTSLRFPNLRVKKTR